MRKLIAIFITTFILFSVSISTIATANTVLATSLSDSIILKLTESHTDNKIDINVKLVTNSGISGMTLELVYNKNVFEYNGYDRGPALENLDLISTDLSLNPSLPVKFNWLNQNVNNDFSTGNMLKLHFTLKPNSSSGDYEIGFKYNDGDIVYINNYHTQSKSAIISKAVVNVYDNKITETKIVETSDDKVNMFLILGVVIFAIAVAVIITLITIKIKRKKRKKNWLKI